RLASWGRHADERKHRTRAGKAFQLVQPALFEGQARAIEKIAGHGRDKHLTWSRKCAYAGGRVHRDAMQVPGGKFDLAGVQSRADLNVQAGECVNHRRGAANAASGAGKEHLEAVACRPDLSAAKPLDLRAQPLIVSE